MKKLLALVLALVMSMSLVTISNADFNDAAEIDYTEAVEVMNAVGVLKGYDNGDFGAKDTLTRAQAAKIIAYLDLGEKVAEALPAVQVYADVPASHWAAKYIAYCADAGYVSGVGDNKFAPDEKVTGYQFGKMLLCVLGYDAKIEDMTGANWSIKVATLMEKKDITDGIDGYASAALTREEAAQYAFNALQAAYVEYENKGTDIDLGSIGNITVGASSAKDNTDKSGDAKTLYEKLFKSDLVRSTSKNDDLGRPAHTWTYKKSEVGTYGDSADYVLVLTKAYTFTTDAQVLAELRDLTDNDKLNYNSATTLALNGKTSMTTSAVFTAVGNTKGLVLELFCNNDADENLVTEVVALDYEIAKVDKIDTKVSKADKEDDVTSYIKLVTVGGDNITNAAKIKDTKFEGFNYEKGDVILYILGAKDKDNDYPVIASQLAKSVEGKVTAKKGDYKVSVDGSDYYETVANIALGAKGTFYLNLADQIMDSKASVEKSGKYAYIYTVDIDDGLNAEGKNAATVKVYYVDQDGVKASAVVDAKVTGDGSSSNPYVATYAGTTTEVKKGVVAYKINSDGEFELTTGENTIKETASTAKKVDEDNAVIDTKINATSKTTFIFVDETTDASKVKVSTADGYKNVSIAASTKVVSVVDDDNYAQYVFVGTKNGNVASTGYVAVLLDTTSVRTEDDDHTYYSYSVAVDGEETTLTVKDKNLNEVLGTSGTAVKKGDVFSYNLEDGYAVDINGTETGINLTLAATVAAETDDYVVIGSKQYDVDEGTLYTITLDYEDGKIDTVTVTEGGSYDTDNKVSYTVDKNGDLVYVFVIEEIK